MNSKADPSIAPFRKGETVTLIGHAGRKVQKLTIVHDPGNNSFITCFDPITKRRVKHARSQLRRTGK